MDFIRSRVSGRGNPTAGQDADLEQAGVSERGQLQGQQETGRGRFGIRRPQVSSIVTNQSSGVNRLQRRTVSGENEDGPKTPRFHLGLPSLPSGRFQFPSLSRIGTRKRSRSSLSREQGQQPSDGSEPRISLQQSQAGQSAVVAEPQPTHVQGDPSSGSSMRSFRGADPAEMHSAGLAETGRRRRHRTNPSESQQGGKPRKFLYCFPWIKSRRVRSQILRCFVSGMFLLMFLVICECPLRIRASCSRFSF